MHWFGIVYLLSPHFSGREKNMTASAYFKSPKILQRLNKGPLGGHIDLYAAQLLEEGHCRQSGWRCLRVVGDFSYWLSRKRLGLSDLDERVVAQYEAFRRRCRCPFSSDRPALIRLLSVLREAGAIAPKAAVSLSVQDQIWADFQRYLDQERGLTRVSIIRHLPVVRRFLRETCARGQEEILRLTQADIIGFLERHAQDQSPDSAKSMCWTLRSFLRYLRYEGRISIDLASCVPTVKRWRYSSLPSFLSPSQVQRVLHGCDRRTAIGRRDYAVLMLLTRLGLRANEVATLALDDVDWRSGQLTVRGKGRRRTQMPLPSDVGGALAAYLRNGRPRSDSRRVFVRYLAPHTGFASGQAVTMIAKKALAGADIDGIAHKGAHVFRHSLATELLRSGASLTEIGQVLGHRDHDTTRIYAKVDIGGLRALSPEWLGVVQ
jgi:site-specific recombinase XerD